MELKIFWSIKFICISIFFQCVNNSSVTPPPTLTKIIERIDGFPLLNTEMNFNGNYTIQIYITNSNKGHNNDKNNTSTTLPPNYVELSRNDKFITSFKLHSKKLTWNQARSTCHEEGGYLAYLDSEDEGKKIKDIMTGNDTGPVWMGMHDLFAEGDWVTVLGDKASSLQYLNWRQNEPNNSNNTEDCAALGMDAMMNDVPCDNLFAYFCKIRTNS